MRLLVGLGNPGARHAHNRHNVGFMAIDEIARQHSFERFRERGRFAGEVAKGRIADHEVLLLKPTTYMNNSGRAVTAARRFFRLAPADIIVIYDEVDLKPGKVRVKLGGGAAGHNGIRDIAEHIGREFLRVRIGVGHPGDRDLVAHYVLHDFAKEDQAWLERTLDAVADAMPLLIAGDENRFMTRVATLAPPPAPPKAEAAQEDGSAEATSKRRDGL